MKVCKILLYSSLVLIVLSTGHLATAQTKGLIYEPSNGTVLDPNGDGYITATGEAFSNDGNDTDEFEGSGWTRFPTIGQGEKLSDIRSGPDEGFTDFSVDPDGYATYLRISGGNIMFRFRLADFRPNAKGYTVLIDTDGLIGPDDVDSYKAGENPGFELGVLLKSKHGVYIIDYDASPSDGACDAVEYTYALADNHQKSISGIESGGNLDAFYEFYVPLADLYTAGGISSSTGLRFAATTNTSNSCTFQGSVSDIGGLDDNDNPCLFCGLVDIIDRQTPTPPDDIVTGGLPTSCPTLSTEIQAGSSVPVSGVAIPGSTVRLYINGSSTADQTVTADGITGAYSATLSSVAVDDVVTATAEDVSAGSPESNATCNTVSVVDACTGGPATLIINPPPGNSSQLSGTTDTGLGLVADLVMEIRLLGTTTLETGDLSTYTTGDGSWEYDLDAVDGDNKFSPNEYEARIKHINGCWSNWVTFCGASNAPQGEIPVVSAPSGSITGGTSVDFSGTVDIINVNGVDGAFIYLYQDGALLGSAEVAGSKNQSNVAWSVPGVDVGTCGDVDVYSVPRFSGSVSGCRTGESDKVTLTVTGTQSATPAISGSYCGDADLIEGTSSEAEGSTIRIYNSGATIIGSTSVNAFGTWAYNGSTISAGTTIYATAQDEDACDSESANSSNITIGTPAVRASIAITDPPITESSTTIEVTGVIGGDDVNVFADGTLILAASASGVSHTFNIPTDYLDSEQTIYAGAGLTATAAPSGGCGSAASTAVVVDCDVPDGGLNLSASDTEVCEVIEDGVVTVESSESGVIYTPYNSSDLSTPIGNSRVGTGGDLDLSIGSFTLTGTETVKVKAMKFVGISCETTLTDAQDYTVNATPDISNFTSPTATVVACPGASSTVTVNSTSLAAATYIVTYDLSIPNAATGLTATMIFAGNSGTFATTNLASSGTTTLTITDIAFQSTACGTTVSSNNTTDITVNVCGGNIAPTASNENVTSNEETNHTFSQSDFDNNYSDGDSDPFAGIKITGIPSNGALIYDGSTLTLADIGTAIAAVDIGKLVFSPAADDNGNTYDSFNFQVYDGSDYSVDYAMTVNITAVNDEPSFTKGADESVLEDAGAQTVTGWATAMSKGPADESGQTLTFTVTNNNNSLFSVQPSVNAATGNLTYTPAANASGTATVSVVLSDDGGTANGGDDTYTTQTFTITVNPVNDEPSFTKGADESVLEDAGAQTVTGWATAMSKGPADESGQTLTFTVTNNNNSLFSVQPSVNAATGNLTYTPAANASGTATVSVVLSDDGGTANGGDDTYTTQTFTITVNPVNDEPSFTKGADESVLEDAGAQTVTGWATAMSKGPADESGQTLTFTVTNNNNSLFSVQPSVNAATGNLTYTPAANASGTATVSVVLSDDGGTANGGDDTYTTQTFTITVNPVNDEPSFTKGADESVLEDAGAQTVTGWATAMSKGPADESGQTLTFTVTNNNNSLFSVQPSVNAATGNLTYTPAANASGTATVSVVLSDDGGTANGGDDTYTTQTFTITVNPVNDEPSFTKGADESVLEDAGAQTVTGWATAMSKGPADESGQTLTFTVTNNNNSLFSVQPSVNAATGNLTYTPAANASGTATVSVVLSDDGGTANGGDDTYTTQTFTITVNPVNDEPSFTKGADESVLEDAGAQTVTGWATAMSKGPADESGQTLTFTVTNNNNSLFSVQPSVNAATGNLTYTPAANASGTATVSVVLSDDGGTANGGDDTYTTQTFTITVNPVNDEPSFTKGADESVLEDAGAQTVTGWATAMSKGPADESGQTLTFTVTNNNNSLFSVQPSVNAATGNLTYTPAANASGTATVSVVLSDDGGTANGGDDTYTTQTFTITVNPVNDEPSFTKGADESVLEDAGAQTVTGWATAMSKGPADESGQTLSFTVTNNNNSLFSVQPSVNAATGNLTYTPAANASGTATVSVVLSDDGGTANGGDDTYTTQTFTITVNPVNDEPSFTKGADESVLEDAGAQTVTGWATAMSKGPADESGQTLSFTVTNNNNSLFSVQPSVNAATGNLTYTPAANASGTATVSVVLSDDGGTANGGDDTYTTQTFTITVNPVNDEPSFTKGADESVLEDAGAQTVTGWATAMSKGPADESGQTLSFTVTNNNNSLFSVQPSVNAATGNLTYTPAANASGTATVSVVLSDDGGTANGGDDTYTTQTFTITVNPVNDEPSFTKGADESVLEDAGAQTVTGWATAMSKGPADESGQTLSFTVTNNNNSLFSVQPSVNAATGNLTYTPAANASGTATVSVVLSDDGGTANGGDDTYTTQTFTITVNPVNDEPSFTKGANQTVDEDAGAQIVTGWATAMSKGPANESGQTLTFNVSNNNNGLFSVQPSVDPITGTLTFTPGTGQSGIATVTIFISDDGGTANGGDDQSDSQTFTITVSPLIINNPPVIAATSETIPEGTTAIETVTATDGDAGDSKAFSISGIDATLFNIDPSTGELTFIAAPDYETPLDDGGDNVYNLDVTVTDGAGNTDTESITVTVTGVNDNDPVIAATSETIPEGTTAIETVTATDGDAGDSKAFSISGIDATLFNIDPSTGELTFIAAPDYETPLDDGGDNVYNLDVTVTDGAGNTDTESITVTVTGVNDNDPVIAATSETIPEGTTAIETVTATDGDAGDSKAFSISGIDATLFNIDPSTGELTFIAAPDYETPLDDGGDNVYNLDVTVTDGAGNTDTESITVTVTGVNDNDPVIAATSETIPEGTTAIETVTATDGDAGDSKAFSISGIDATLFNIDPSTGELTFIAAPDYETPLDDGGDNVYNLDVTVTDGAGNTDTESITVTVTGVNDNDPVIAATSETIPEGTTAIETVTATDGDAGDSKAFSISGIDATLFNIDPSTGELTFIAAPDYETPLDDGGDNVYNLDVTVTDGAGNTDTESITVTVTGVNDNDPVIAATSETIPEGTTAIETVTATDGDAGDSKAFSISGIDATLFNIDPSTGELTFIAAPDYETPLDDGGDNVYNLDVTVTDGAGNTDTESITVTVTGVNDNDPVIAATSETIPEGTTAIETVTATDGDAGDSKAFSISGIDATLFNIDPSTGELTFIAAPDYETPLDDGGDNVYNLDVTVTDGAGNTDTESITVTVTGVNDNDPVIAATSETIPEGTTAIETVTATDGDAGDSKAFSISGIDATLFNIDPSTGELTFIAAPDYETPLDDGGDNVYNLDVTVTDGAGNTDTESITVTVTNTNDNPPVAEDDSGIVDEDGILNGINLLANDSDADGDALSITTTPVLDVVHGTLVINPDGTYTYTPEPGYSGSDGFTYEVCDGAGSCATAVVSLIIVPADNKAPVAENDAATVDEGGVLNGTSLLANDSDPDGDDLNINTTPVTGVVHGVLVINPDGTYVYTPDPGYSGSDTFIYEVCDINGSCNTAEVTITIVPVHNNDPIAEDDTADIDDQGILTASNLLDNDSDPDGDNLIINTTPVIDANHGILVINPDGTFTYVPDDGFSGEDSFTYQVCDDKGGCSTALVVITVVPLDDDWDDDGIPNDEEGDEDVDGDGKPNNRDTDSDDDGIPDAVETEDDIYADCDEDGKYDYLDPDKCDVVPEKGFSPNGDGIAEGWYIKGIEGHPDNHVKVFNRWGNLIFEVIGYDNDEVAWFGQSEGAMILGEKNVPDGTYFYLIDLQDGAKPLSGYIVLKR